MTSSIKLLIYDAITRNPICEANLQEFTKIDTFSKQSAYGKCGEVIMRFFKNTHFLGVYFKNSGEFLVLKIIGISIKEVKKLQLQDKLSFIEMDPFSKNTFIFGSNGIEMGNIKTQRVLCIEQGISIEVKIEESSQDIQDEEEEEERSFSTEREQNYLKEEFEDNRANIVKQTNDDKTERERRIGQPKAENGTEGMILEGQRCNEESDLEQEEDDDENDNEDDDDEDDENEKERNAEYQQNEDEQEEMNEESEGEEEQEEEKDKIEEQMKNEINNQDSSMSVEGSDSPIIHKRNIKIAFKKKNDQSNEVKKTAADQIQAEKLKQATQKEFFVAAQQSLESANIIETESLQNKQTMKDKSADLTCNTLAGPSLVKQADQSIKLEKGEIKLMNSSSCAIYLKQRCSKYKKVILGIVNRDIVIYEVTISQQKEIGVQLINRLKLNDLHMYDMSFVQLASNIQNTKFSLALDRKFMHIFSLSDSLTITSLREEFLNQDQIKRYQNPLFWRDPYEKDKPEYFIYMDNTNLNCSIVFTNMSNAKKNIVILQGDRPRNIFNNLRWEASIGVIGEGGGMFVIEAPRLHYWENFSYRFKGLSKNYQYVEKEDEFDVNEESNKIRTLTLNEFDNLKTNYADFIYPASNKMLIDGNISAS